MNGVRCSRCGTTQNVALYNLCPRCDDIALGESRAESGLGFFVTDGPTLDRVAVLFSTPASSASENGAAPVLPGAENGAVAANAGGPVGNAAPSRGATTRSTSEKATTSARSHASEAV